MSKQRLAPIVLVALAVGFTAGVFSGAVILIGPGGYRPPTSAGVPSPQPSPTTPSAPAFLPNYRADAAMAFDAATGEMVMFGGDRGGETWTWNGTRWRLMPRQADAPLARFNPTLTYDPTHKTVVMRGGINTDFQSLDETWTWDGKRWTRMSPSQSPPVWITTADEPMVWDSNHNRVLLFAYTRCPFPEYDVPDLNQLWSWDGTSWNRLDASGDIPSGHGYFPASIAYERAHKAILFFGHIRADPVWTGHPTTWLLDGATWRKVSTSGPQSTRFIMASDDARSNIVLLDERSNTWTWDGMNWNLLNPVHSPTFRLRSAMAYDSVRHVVVLFNGYGLGSNPSNELWTWNGTDWTQVGLRS